MKKLMMAALAAATVFGAFAKGPEKAQKVPEKFHIGFAAWASASREANGATAASAAADLKTSLLFIRFSFR